MVDAYLSGELSEREAEALEAHYFACDDCWRRIEAARSLRASALEADVHLTDGQGPAIGRRARRAAAAAVAVTALAMGLWQVAGTGEEDRQTGPTFRGEEAALELQTGVRGGTLSLGWKPHPGAVRYRVRVHAPDGRLLLERRVRRTRLRVELSELPSAGSALPVYGTVEALDRLDRPVARTGPVRAPPESPRSPEPP